jgi:hypothetical protein
MELMTRCFPEGLWFHVGVVTRYAVLRFIHVLHHGKQRAILCDPCLPTLPGLKERTRQIGGLPDALVGRVERVPVQKYAVHDGTPKGLGIPEQVLNIRLFPLLEHLRCMGTVLVAQAVGMDRHTMCHRTLGMQR